MMVKNSIRAVSISDAARILEIYAPSIIDSSTSFEVEVPSLFQMEDRIREYSAFAPWLVYEVDGTVVGYAYASKHRAREAYQWTVEVSVYVDPNFHKRGIARSLYDRLFEELKELGFHLALSGTVLPNRASVGFHEAMGFTPIGIYRNVGFKLGKWHDVGWWQKTILPFDKSPSPLRKSH
jgi:L-amino acid N-acyltransferase YncA